MAKTYSLQEALHKAAALCSSAEQCESDIREKLSRWGIAQAGQNEIIERLKKEKYLDETRFTQSFVNDKIRFNKWGKIKIRYALRQKNISPSVLSAALENVDPELYKNTLNEILAVKAGQVKAETEFDKKGKLYKFALSRGFEPDLIARVLKYEMPS